MLFQALCRPVTEFEPLLLMLMRNWKTLVRIKRWKIILPFSLLRPLICITMYLNMDERQFRAETAKLPHIQIYCNTNDQGNCEKCYYIYSNKPTQWRDLPRGIPPYISHVVMCHCGGYGFQPDWYGIGYKNQGLAYSIIDWKTRDWRSSSMEEGRKF